MESKALRIMAEQVVGVAEARPKGFSNLRPHISRGASMESTLLNRRLRLKRELLSMVL